MYQEIKLKPKKDESLRRFHPWVFSGAIAQDSGMPREGEVVRILSSEGTLLGVGHYQVGSISVRMLSFRDEIIDHAFYRTALTRAL